MIELRLAALALFLLASGALPGCQTYVVRREPVTTAQIIAMVEGGRTPEDIIECIRDSHTVYILHARDVKDLLDKGVPEVVVDEMLHTRLRDLEHRRYWYPYNYPYPYYYGSSIGFGYGFHYHN